MTKSEKAQILGKQAAQFDLLNWANKYTICPYDGKDRDIFIRSYERTLSMISNGKITQKQYQDLPSIEAAKEDETGYFLTVPTQFIPSKVICVNCF